MASDSAGCLPVAGAGLGHLLQRGRQHCCRIAVTAGSSRARWLGRLVDVTPGVIDVELTAFHGMRVAIMTSPGNRNWDALSSTDRLESTEGGEKMAQPGNARFVGERLGQFVAASRWHALPQALRREGKRSLLNFIGCALGVTSLRQSR